MLRESKIRTPERSREPDSSVALPRLDSNPTRPPPPPPDDERKKSFFKKPVRSDSKKTRTRRSQSSGVLEESRDASRLDVYGKRTRTDDTSCGFSVKPISFGLHRVSALGFGWTSRKSFKQNDRRSRQGLFSHHALRYDYFVRKPAYHQPGNSVKYCYATNHYYIPSF